MKIIKDAGLSLKKIVCVVDAFLLSILFFSRCVEIHRKIRRVCRNAARPETPESPLQFDMLNYYKLLKLYTVDFTWKCRAMPKLIRLVISKCFQRTQKCMVL